eukprot:1654907-Rhodomonas_salina.1
MRKRGWAAETKEGVLAATHLHKHLLVGTGCGARHTAASVRTWATTCLVLRHVTHFAGSADACGGAATVCNIMLLRAKQRRITVDTCATACPPAIEQIFASLTGTALHALRCSGLLLIRARNTFFASRCPPLIRICPALARCASHIASPVLLVCFAKLTLCTGSGPCIALKVPSSAVLACALSLHILECVGLAVIAEGAASGSTILAHRALGTRAAPSASCVFPYQTCGTRGAASARRVRPCRAVVANTAIVILVSPSGAQRTLCSGIADTVKSFTTKHPTEMTCKTASGV